MVAEESQSRPRLAKRPIDTPSRFHVQPDYFRHMNKVSNNSHRSQQVRLLTWLIRPQGRPEASVSAATAHAPLFCEWKPRHFPLNFTAFWELQWLFKSSEKLSSFRKYFWGSQFRFFYIHQNLTKRLLWIRILSGICERIWGELPVRIKNPGPPATALEHCSFCFLRTYFQYSKLNENQKSHVI